MTQYVPNETYIPVDDLQAIRNRLINQIKSMDDAELRIIEKSQKDLRDFVADIFKAVAATFGYVIGVVVGTLEEIFYGIKEGFEGGFNAGRRQRR